MMLHSIIVAMAANRVIGRDNALPWRLPADLRRFRQRTMGHSLIMGRRTFESLPGPLAGRRIIVLSRDPACQCEGARRAGGLAEALDMAAADESGPDGEVFFAGGADVYRQALDMGMVDRIYMTEVSLEPDGDALFPAIEPGQWREIEREDGDDQGITFCFRTMERAGDHP